MSVITALLALASGLAARIERPNVNADVEITQLREQLEEARRQRDEWRERCIQAIPSPQDIFAQNAIMAQMAQTQQYHALMNQNAQQVHQWDQNGLNTHQLGAQNLLMGEEWCNCVPARHDMFLRG